MKRLVTVISIIAFFALLYYCVSYMQAPVSTISATSVTKEKVIDGDAFIVRNETVYTAPGGGTVYSYAREGARVGKDRRVCAVYSSGADEKILQELGTINTKIAELSSAVAGSDSYTADSGSQEERLLQLYERIEAAAAENNIEEIAKCKTEIESLLGGAQAVSRVDQIAELTREKQALESGITGPKKDIFATVSGIYSTKIDGYENVLKTSIIDGITVEEFSKIKPEEAPEEAKDEDAPTPDIKACKIIGNHEWYVMALVDREAVEGVKAGKEVKVRFSKLPGEETTAKVEAISQDPEGQKKAVLVLKCESFSEGAFSIRASSVEVILESYTGFEVPVHAIRVKDGQNGVSVRVGGSDVFKPCKMIYKDEKKGNAIVVADTEDVNKQLRQYDMIVVGEK